MVLLPSTEPNTALVGDSIELAVEIDGRKRRGGGDGIVRAAVGPNTRLKEALGLDPRVVDYYANAGINIRATLIPLLNVAHDSLHVVRCSNVTPICERSCSGYWCVPARRPRNRKNRTPL